MPDTYILLNLGEIRIGETLFEVSFDIFVLYKVAQSFINLLISAGPQRQTNVKGCRIFGDLEQLKPKDTTDAKNGTLIPTAKTGKEIKQQ